MRLHRCSSCRRHVRLDESHCPFCRTETVARTAVSALTIGGALTGCSPSEPPQAAAEESTSTVSSTTALPTTITNVTSSADDSATLDSGDDLDDESSYDDGWDTCVGFYGCFGDGGGNTVECDIWAQDCSVDEKCMPWANDGGYAWNATRCSPLDPRPGQAGDACAVEGSGVSGIDNCDVGNMCWNVDPSTKEGVCIGFCQGSAANPVCEDPATECTIMNDGVLILCLRPCDPLLSGCGPTEGCYAEPGRSAFFCAPDASDASGAHGDACEAPESCDPGLACADPEAVVGCMDSGCCTQLCDLTSELPDAPCSGASDGETCVAYFADGEAPVGLEHVGICVLPEA
jgi:hypothetical protein